MTGINHILSRYEAFGQKGMELLQGYLVPATASTPLSAAGSIALNIFKLQVCRSCARALDGYVKYDKKKNLLLSRLETIGSLFMKVEMVRSGWAIANNTVGILLQKDIVTFIGRSNILRLFPQGNAVLGIITVASHLLLGVACIASALTLWDAHFWAKMNSNQKEAGNMVVGAVGMVVKTGLLFYTLVKILPAAK